MLKISCHEFKKNPHVKDGQMQFLVFLVFNKVYSIFTLPGPGLVVSGLLLSGVLKENDTVFFGPIDKNFKELKVASIKCFDQSFKSIQPNEFATVALGSSFTFKFKSLKVLYF